jgi:hypothetical protein
MDAEKLVMTPEMCELCADTMTVEEKLDKIAEMQSEIDSLSARRFEEQDKVLPAEIREALEAVDTKFDREISDLRFFIEGLKTDVTNMVLKSGGTAKGKYIMATWNKGRAGGWDNGKLEGFALVHPEILKAKKPDGEPTVSFRAVK